MFRETIRTIIGFISGRHEDLTDDESDQIIELVAKYAEVNIILAARGLDYNRIETLFHQNLDITLHLAHLTTWDRKNMRIVHLLSRLIETYLCLSGELLIRHLQVASVMGFSCYFDGLIAFGRNLYL